MTRSTPTTFGAWLRKQRQKDGFGVREFARLCGVTAATLSNIEHDHYVPSEDVIAKLASHLDITNADINIALSLAGRIPLCLERDILRHPELWTEIAGMVAR
jgi:transcriptional regulator with XRE-family HTH domain